MFSTGSKYFFGITFLGAIAFAVYMLLIGESAIGGTALFGLVGATGLLTALVLFTRDGSNGEEGVAASTASPTSSIWPLIAAVGATPWTGLVSGWAAAYSASRFPVRRRSTRQQGWRYPREVPRSAAA